MNHRPWKPYERYKIRAILARAFSHGRRLANNHEMYAETKARLFKRLHKWQKDGLMRRQAKYRKRKWFMMYV